jgi:hypothetical protein
MYIEMTRNVIATVLLEVTERDTRKSLEAPIERTYRLDGMGDLDCVSDFDILYYAKNRYLQERRQTLGNGQKQRTQSYWSLVP